MSYESPSGGLDGLVVSKLVCGTTMCLSSVCICLSPEADHLDLPPSGPDGVIKGLGMSRGVCATGHIKDPVPLVKKNKASCPSGRLPPSFIHQ